MQQLNLSIEKLNLVHSELTSFKKEMTASLEVLTNGLKEDMFDSSDEAIRLKLKKNKVALNDEVVPKVKAMIARVDKVLILTSQAIREASK
ncbi:hypothetical protein [Clostridium tertium]|uniref:hypothetical protein n=1 Tax=Clostridium tertium TaxID=1559 RepID=UPI0023B22E3F|nr:hypothetical protein [Clostridium tertium]